MFDNVERRNVAAPINARPHLIFSFYVFYTEHFGGRRHVIWQLPRHCTVNVDRCPATSSMVRLLGVVTVTMASVNVTMAATVVRHNMTYASTVSVTSPNVTNLRTVTRIIIFRRHAMCADRVNRPAIRVI